ncbi:MAG TPA: S24/S26 family peptidase [Opitutaceae bacterium]|nr:S24/S26 family peptidase [Opitutaceae bacterium]
MHRPGDLGRAPPEIGKANPTEAWIAAEQLAAQHEGDFVLHGVGDSMVPIFCDGTVVVVHPTSFFMLQRGSHVVYLNRRGRAVAHVLVERLDDGWVAAGLNNPQPDDERVTASNLVGVIRCAFIPSTAAARPDPLAWLPSSRRKSNPVVR